MTSRAPGAGAAVAFAVMALAQIAIPLTDDRATTEWLSSLVVVAFAATTFALATRGWGWWRAAAAAGFIAVVTLAVERLGTGTGFPFGEYHYTGALQPTVAGVPLIVPLAWFAMGVPALEAGHRIARSPVLAVVAGALALTAWDLFLDPQMVEEGYWRWRVDGAYEGIPLTNYAGWVGVGLIVLAAVERIRPPTTPADPWLVGAYTWWAVMNTVGFLVFFDRPLVGAVGGAGMGVFAVLAWRGRGRRG